MAVDRSDPRVARHPCEEAPGARLDGGPVTFRQAGERVDLTDQSAAPEAIDTIVKLKLDRCWFIEDDSRDVSRCALVTVGPLRVMIIDFRPSSAAGVLASRPGFILLNRCPSASHLGIKECLLLERCYVTVSGEIVRRRDLRETRSRITRRWRVPEPDCR